MIHDNTHPQSDPLLEDLTDPQREAVSHVQGPLLVLAGAGSGKTRVITRRIAYLVLRVGIAPWNVLAITFTNKAAGEMRDRIGQLVSPRQANAVTACTFHSLCARLIREYSDRLGLPRTYSIYDTGDQTRVMKEVLKAMRISTGNFPPGKVLSTISHAKGQMVDPEAYAASASDFYSRAVGKIYKKYQTILTQNNALDFDDLLRRTVILLKDHPDVLAQLRERYQYLLIDEYQDTNHAQFTLAYALSAGHQNICATGDPDQSIYGWRGADISNILEFENHYPGVTTVRLEQNYRSTKSILAVADQLIKCNTHRRHKLLWTENEDGQPVQVITCHDERHEAQWVVDWFTDLRRRGDTSWGQMAVFYRVNSLSRVIEDALRLAGVPYQIARGTSFYERREIKDAVAYLRAIANPADEVNLLRIINIPSRGISANTIRAMKAHAVAHGVSLVTVISNSHDVSSLNSRAATAVQRFATMLNTWQVEAGLQDGAALGNDLQGATPVGHSLRRFVEGVLRDSGLEEYFRNDKSDPDHERLMNLGELISSVQQFEQEYDDKQQDSSDPEAQSLSRRLESYLEQISLMSDVDAVDAEEGAVTLMTLHAAKGLEFSAVAMIGLEDGLLPHHEANTDSRKLEEERRLCFVGITRAQKRLAMTCTHCRTIFGQLKPAIPSRFFSEMPPDHLEEKNLASGGIHIANGHSYSQADPKSPSSQDEESNSGFPPGSLVRHPQFGLGRIIDVRQGGAQTRARVEFNTAGVKTLILQYARLEKVAIG